MIKKMLLAVIVTVLVFLLAGCQTVHGLGEDVKWLGEKTAEAAD